MKNEILKEKSDFRNPRVIIVIILLVLVILALFRFYFVEPLRQEPKKYEVGSAEQVQLKLLTEAFLQANDSYKIKKTFLSNHHDISKYGNRFQIAATYYYLLKQNLTEESLNDYDQIKVLADKIQIVAANKTDVSTELLEEFVEEMENRGHKVFPVSAATNKGIDELLKYAYDQLKKIPETRFEIEEIEADVMELSDEFSVYVDDEGVYNVEGEQAEYIINSTNFDDNESLNYFQRILRKKGIIDMLEQEGIKDGDTVRMADVEFEYYR